ncbi:MAG: DUF5916 domain-containing protein [Salinivirgaceae bacterium]|jgi:hypothetical protein|nr:DUF5916 domain-containing protein [Salinivirgaceae bacterium]
MRYFIVVFCFLLIQKFGLSQENKSVEALRINSPLIIDGYLNDDVYKSAKPAKDFVQLQPYNGKPSFQPSEAFFFYDESAIYVGAMLYDSSPDSIFNMISRRDQIGMSDYFGVYFDPYNEGQLAYGFFITPAGVQTDIKAVKSEWDYEDGNWDAVWQSKTRVADNGWIVELRIPYSALRFPDKEVHTWGLNMFRNIRRYSSNNSWNFVDREVSGFIHQQGELTDIKDIVPPVRLSLSPYLAGYGESKGDGSPTDYTFKGGMDLKYGINESFTLDMMLIPDFGEIQSDDQQLNLSPYELYYDERRQFFTEGTELFQRGGIFYSRRIGAWPKFSSNAEDDLEDNEVVHYNPITTQLVNATKISGRTTDGWGVGVLNAMTLSSNSTLKDTLTGKLREVNVQPFTNYNVTVVDKTLKNNSYVSLINTNMAMYDNSFGANVTATEFQLRDKNKKYALVGKGGVSSRYNDETETGGFADLAFKKNSGKLNITVGQKFYSEDYNPNDMGYLTSNNKTSSSANISYNIVEPFFIFKEWHGEMWYMYERIVNPSDKYRSEIGAWSGMDFKNSYWLSTNGGVNFEQNDYFEARVSEYYYYRPLSYWLNIFVNSDRRKTFSMDASIGNSNVPTTSEYGYWTGIGMDFRLGQRFRFEYDFYYENSFNDKGYVDNTENEDTVFFGKRDVQSIENEFEMDVALNNKLSLSFRARHYWSGVEYKTFYQLQKDDGSLLEDADYDEVSDVNYNIFNIDMVLRWQFAPGSEMSLAWKNAIFDDYDKVIYRYSDNINKTRNADILNSVSIKLLYYIDYNLIKNLKREK